MSLNEITRSCYQNGIAAKKWLNLCKLFASKVAAHSSSDALQMEMCNSVLALLSSYPGDATLRRYLKTAVEDGFLPLHVYISSFLLGVSATDLHDADTLDMLCRVALDALPTSIKQPSAAIIPPGATAADILTSAQLVLQLVRTAGMMSVNILHPLYNSLSELLYLFLSSISDISTIAPSQAFSFINEATAALSILRLSPVRQLLETFIVQLLQITDDSRLALDAQMVHSQQFAGTGDIIGPSSDSDIVSFSLLFQTLLLYRGREYGSGDEPYTTGLLVAFHRWSSWNPMTFYKQLLYCAVNMVAHANVSSSSGFQYRLTRAFVTGRLPHLLVSFEKAVELEGTKFDWRGAMHFAVTSLFHHHDLLQGCEIPEPMPVESQSSASAGGKLPSFMGELVHQLSEHNLLEHSFVASVFPTQSNDHQSKIRTEAQDAGMDMKTYLESKLTHETNGDETDDLVRRVCKDSCSHSAFAEIVVKRFSSQASPTDIEALSHLCKILLSHKDALEMLSLHAKLSVLASPALVLLEDYDCETVGDPQTAVSHLGDIVLFLQTILARFNLTAEKLSIGERKLNPGILLSANIIYRPEDLKSSESVAFHAWSKALFDSGSEGIEDGILRSTPPRTLLKIAATLVSTAIQSCTDRKIDKDTLNNGISYFLGPLLNWTLAGIVRVLVSEIHHRKLHAPLHLDVLQQLVTSPSFPQTVLHLSAGPILRIFPRPTVVEGFDSTPIRRAALHTLSIPDEGHLSLNAGQSNGPHQLIRQVLADAATGKPPVLNVEHCLYKMPPTQFLPALYSELVSVRQIETPRRIATYVLATPRPPSSPPLLPIFLHVTLPMLIASLDTVSPPEQAIAAELLVAIISSALTAALYTEWALLSVCNEQRVLLGQTTTALARRLGGDLRRKAAKSPMSDAIARRLASSQPFVSNFPSFMADS